MKGVVMLAAGYFPYIGGAEGQARSVAAALHARGVPVQVLTRRMPGMPKEDVVDGVPVHRLPAFGPGPVAPAVFLAAAFLALIRRRNEYDAIHVHLASSPAVAAAAAGRLLGKRVLVKLGGGKGYGELATSRRTFLGRLKLRALIALKPALVAVNPVLLKELAGSGLERLETAVLPNGVDTERFKPASEPEKRDARRRLGWTSGFVLLMVARLDRDKGVDVQLPPFLEAWAALAPAGARLMIAGTGPAESALKRKADAAKASAVFMGARPDVETLYKAADAFLLPSSSEGLSNALLEALASGLPVLATRVTGTADVITDGKDGLLYTPGNASELALQLRRLLEEAPLRTALAGNARETALRYSLPRAVDRWLALYKDGAR